MKIHVCMFLLASVALVGCKSLNTRPSNLDQYLQQFIGKTSAEIQSTLNFRALGYKVSDKIQTTSNTLSYTILRQINIPMAGSNAIVGSTIAIATPSYNINFNCKVIFLLKNGVAESVEYLGRAC